MSLALKPVFGKYSISHRLSFSSNNPALSADTDVAGSIRIAPLLRVRCRRTGQTDGCGRQLFISDRPQTPRGFRSNVIVRHTYTHGIHYWQTVRFDSGGNNNLYSVILPPAPRIPYRTILCSIASPARLRRALSRDFGSLPNNRVFIVYPSRCTY